MIYTSVNFWSIIIICLIAFGVSAYWVLDYYKTRFVNPLPYILVLCAICVLVGLVNVPFVILHLQK